MRQPTGKVTEIATLADFLKVPVDQIDDAVDALKVALRMIVAVALESGCREDQIATMGFKVGPILHTDDGKRNVNILMKPGSKPTHESEEPGS